VRRAPAAALLASLALLAAGPASAQTAVAQVDPGPHYVGETIALRISASGFAEEPAPEVEVEPPARGRLVFAGATPSVSESITIVNGQVTRKRDVSHVFEYHFVADEPGSVTVGPFRVVQGSVERTVDPVRIEIRDVPTRDDISVGLELPKEPIFVGQRVPVRLVFRIERGLQRNLQGYELRVPLFDRSDRFLFVDPDSGRAGGTKVVIDTASGQLELRGKAVEEAHVLAVSVERTLVPLRAGPVQVPAASLIVDEGTAFRRDFFGGRAATRVRKWRANDVRRVLDVEPIPSQGRPPSFAGAVGHGFTLEVSADRTVVQVGDPIELTLTLRGEGLEAASLPPLDAPGLLPRDRFRVPTGDLAGSAEGDAKRFHALVRVLDAGVREIPALEYSWFDPTTRRFETTASRPIALSVREGEVIGAAEVQSAQSETPAPKAEPAAPLAETRERSLALTGADLAIVRSAPRLLRDARAAHGGAWLPPGLYAASVLLVAAAFLDRRRRDVDPALLRRRRLLDAELARVRGAGALPPERALDEVCGALRRMLAEAPHYRDPEVDAFLAECDARRYAPEGRERGADEALCGRAERLARGIAEGGR
jgi:BatD DUF11 like domain